MKAFVFFVLLAAALEEAHPQPRLFRAPESTAARLANITTLSQESSKDEVDFETYCRPPADRGPCKGYFPSWWYNAGRRRCEEFVYTGCAGNKNNYVTKEECERTCVRERDTPEASTTQNPMYREYEEMITCHLEPDQGSCRENIPRYYYDWRSRACKQFIYGGCLGNTNNFVSMEVCRQKCAKEAHSHPQLFRAPESTAPRLANITTLSQESSKAEVDFETYCRPPADRGPCKGYFPSWWYNAGRRRCEEFVYTGCAGNKNNYVTKEDCERTCVRERDTPEGSTTQNPMYREYEEMITCHLEPDQGSCRENIPRYYYDWRSRACKQFIYGGCLGNTNNFVSMEVCQQMCAKDAHPQSVLLRVPEVVDPVCLEPKKPGRCKGYFPRYYFNTTLKTCQDFIYGGCDANRNNFATLEECKNTCWVSMNQKTVEPPEAFDVPYWPRAIPEDCAHPPDMGPCKASIPRFFYNTVSKSCVQFLYGGCGGNANNFLTYTQCEEKCKTLGSVIPRA